MTTVSGRKRIGVLFHRSERHGNVARYIIHEMAECWRDDGHDVFYLFGLKDAPAADAMIVHVNLSVVPDAYLEFAARYPIVLNGGARDIRKSTISSNLVQPGDGWTGPVIVKSDLNYAGEPERLLGRTAAERRWPFARRIRRLFNRINGNGIAFANATDYKIYDAVAEVPGEWFKRRDVVVERFRPEIEDGLYHTRIFQFLGDRWTCTRVAGKAPIVKTEGAVRLEDIEPPEEVVAWREAYHLDYGKLDYVVNDGEIVLIDVNKTTGASSYAGSEERKRLRRYRAEGLYSYFSD